MFHKSCFIKKTKKCCDKQLYVEEEKQKEIEDIQIPLDDTTMEKPITLENKLLKEMNKDLRENILLLEEKIDNQKQILNS